MLRVKWSRVEIDLKRLAIMAMALVVVIPSCFIDWFAVQQRVPVWLYLQTELVILIGIEIAYGVALLLSGAAVPGTSIRLGSPLFDIGDSVKERKRRIGRTEEQTLSP